MHDFVGVCDFFLLVLSSLFAVHCYRSQRHHYHHGCVLNSTSNWPVPTIDENREKVYVLLVFFFGIFLFSIFPLNGFFGGPLNFIYFNVLRIPLNKLFNWHCRMERMKKCERPRCYRAETFSHSTCHPKMIRYCMCLCRRKVTLLYFTFYRFRCECVVNVFSVSPSRWPNARSTNLTNLIYTQPCLQVNVLTRSIQFPSLPRRSPWKFDEVLNHICHIFR